MVQLSRWAQERDRTRKEMFVGIGCNQSNAKVVTWQGYPLEKARELLILSKRPFWHVLQCSYGKRACKRFLHNLSILQSDHVNVLDAHVAKVLNDKQHIPLSRNIT